jgi:hypothetical protein
LKLLALPRGLEPLFSPYQGENNSGMMFRGVI